tara:strand:- start:1333 stop:1521 length:189 start_codon:yes stop_codon:yes gene_type:complete
MRKIKIGEVTAKIVQHAVVGDDGRQEGVITTLVRTPIDLGINAEMTPQQLEQCLIQTLVEMN